MTRQQLKEPFINALIAEIYQFKNSPQAENPYKTIYIGGGTPSLLSEQQLSRIFTALHDVFTLKTEEVTMEMNPDDVTADYLRMIKSYGVNRASMGVQSFHKSILKFMHRAHTQKEAVKALEALQKANFPAFTADLIYGNPDQTASMLKEDIDTLVGFDPPHISAYSLTVEPKTRLGKQVQLGRISPPDDDTVSEQFDILRDRLYRYGIEQYEVSNFSKPGKEAVHNSNYWRHKNYLGLGPSANSFWWGDRAAKRWRNKPNIKLYLTEDPNQYREEAEELSLQTLAEERLMLGLRTKWGVQKQYLLETYGYRFSSSQQEWLDEQVRNGFIRSNGNTILMTHKGLKISDHLIVQLLGKG